MCPCYSKLTFCYNPHIQPQWQFVYSETHVADKVHVFEISSMEIFFHSIADFLNFSINSSARRSRSSKYSKGFEFFDVHESELSPEDRDLIVDLFVDDYCLFGFWQPRKRIDCSQ